MDSDILAESSSLSASYPSAHQLADLDFYSSPFLLPPIYFPPQQASSSGWDTELRKSHQQLVDMSSDFGVVR